MCVHNSPTAAAAKKVAREARQHTRRYVNVDSKHTRSPPGPRKAKTTQPLRNHVCVHIRMRVGFRARAHGRHEGTRLRTLLGCRRAVDCCRCPHRVSRRVDGAAVHSPLYFNGCCQKTVIATADDVAASEGAGRHRTSRTTSAKEETAWVKAYSSNWW